jgi:hypothetical protein
MSLSRKIAAALDARAEAGGLPAEVSASDGPHKVALTLEAGGKVGVAFDRLEYTCAERTDWSAEALKAWGDRLAARLTYLMEPLVVLEVDAVGGEVELRSQLPTARDGTRSYYELRLDRGGTLRLTRKVYDESTRTRRAASCQLTREALERLADDLAASVS